VCKEEICPAIWIFPASGLSAKWRLYSKKKGMLNAVLGVSTGAHFGTSIEPGNFVEIGNEKASEEKRQFPCSRIYYIM
jgi:hypothetical protein